uniref:Riboflavin kinase n=1 Tax=Steinernema glaseri TaxID=37863 RepID=A0A1I7Y1E1_9BILA
MGNTDVNRSLVASPFLFAWEGMGQLRRKRRDIPGSIRIGAFRLVGFTYESSARSVIDKFAYLGHRLLGMSLLRNHGNPPVGHDATSSCPTYLASLRDRRIVYGFLGDAETSGTPWTNHVTEMTCLRARNLVNSVKTEPCDDVGQRPNELGTAPGHEERHDKPCGPYSYHVALDRAI